MSSKLPQCSENYDLTIVLLNLEVNNRLWCAAFRLWLDRYYRLPNKLAYWKDVPLRSGSTKSLRARAWTTQKHRTAACVSRTPTHHVNYYIKSL